MLASSFTLLYLMILRDQLISCCGCLVTDGYICSRTKKPVEASSILSLEELPPILILHLKRFVYSGASGGCQKVKAIFLKEKKYKIHLCSIFHVSYSLSLSRDFGFCIWESMEFFTFVHNNVNVDLIFNWHTILEG